MTRQAVLASNNVHKLAELRILLEPLGLQLLAQSDFKIDSVAETGSTFVENALLKARHATYIAGLPAIADDSGLFVPSLDGAPGVRSSRYAGESASDQCNNEKLLQELDPYREGDPRRVAHFAAVLVYLDSTMDPLPTIAHGIWKGQLVRAPRGSSGFGYDPLFVPDGQSKTVAELSSTVKNQLSHRARAVNQFLALLKERL